MRISGDEMARHMARRGLLIQRICPACHGHLTERPVHVKALVESGWKMLKCEACHTTFGLKEVK